MSESKNKLILFGLIVIAAIILIVVGSTFAYFSVSISSNENAVVARAAEFSLGLDDDISLIKNHIIPSEEQYVDIAVNRVQNGEFIKPYTDENTGQLVTANTVCIDDNLNEICSVYTFTIINEMTDMDIPLYVTLNTSVNTFENLYYKVLDSELNEVIHATPIVDDREYTLDGQGNKVYEAGSTISPTVLEGINNTLNRATDSETPSTVTYSLVMWIMENHQNQNATDGGKMFATTLNVKASGSNGNGITGVIAAAGTE